MHRRYTIALSFLPTIVLLALGYIAPIASNVVGSLQDANGQWVGLQNYIDVITSYYFLDSLLFTVKVAFVATALSMIIAVITALALRPTFIGKKLIVWLYQINMTVPRMAAAMILLLLLSQTGFISQIFNAIGLTQGATQFPWLVRDSGGVGLVIAFTWKFFPYIGMSVLGVLQGASTEFEMQAACLGLGKFKRFVHITLPLIVPATSIASIIVFAAAFGDYEIPAILGSSSHRMLSIYTYTLFTDSALMNKPHAYVLMILMTLVLMVIILLYRHLTMGMPTNAKGVEGGEGATGSRKRGSLRRVEVRDRATLGNRAGGANE